MSLINDYEFRVFGLRRSGNHAITSWIIGHFPDNSVYYYNDVQKIIENNYFSGRLNFPVDIFSWKNRYICPGKKRSGIIWRSKNYLQIHSKSKLVAGATIASKLVVKDKYNLKEIKSSNKLCLIQTYEDQPLEIIDFIEKQKIGQSKNVFNVLILRDVRNMIASRLEHKNIYTKMDESVISLWKKYAYEYLGDSNYLGKNKILVNYDCWVDSKIYREKLSRSLKLSFSDIGLHDKTKFGGGSSFKESREFNSRYLSYMDDPEYKKYIDDELLFLNDSIHKACWRDVDTNGG